MRRLLYVQDGHDLLVESKAVIPEADALALSSTPHARRGVLLWGRPPNKGEWEKLNGAYAALGRNLPPEARLLLRTQSSRRLITWLPVYILAFAILGIVVACSDRFLVVPLSPFVARFTGYLLWTLALGILGAAASLGVNALAIKSDATFDVTDRALVILRVVIGAVFAFVLSLMFTWDSFGSFTSDIGSGISISERGDLLDTAWRLLLPFLLGFSTPLVLTILERFIVSIETFFGARVANPAPPSPGPLARTGTGNTTGGAGRGGAAG